MEVGGYQSLVELRNVEEREIPVVSALGDRVCALFGVRASVVRMRCVCVLAGSLLFHEGERRTPFVCAFLLFCMPSQHWVALAHACCLTAASVLA